MKWFLVLLSSLILFGAIFATAALAETAQVTFEVA